jgi:hypothetical protein
METTRLYQMTAVAGWICGGAIAAAAATELVVGAKVPVTQVLNGSAVPFGMLLLVGLYLTVRIAVGTFGAIAAVVHFLGFGFFAGIAYTRNFVLTQLDQATLDRLLAGPARWAFLATAGLALLSTVLFAAAITGVREIPRGAVACYTIGLSVLCLTFLLPAPLVRCGHVVAGAGICWLALYVWRSSGRSDIAGVDGAPGRVTLGQ